MKVVVAQRSIRRAGYSEPMPHRARSTRTLALQQLRRRLEDDSWPRLQMALMVALTGTFGLVCSFVLLKAGVGSMALRYPLALIGAYLFFLALLWLWLRTKAEDYADGADLVELVPMPMPRPGMPAVTVNAGGGDFAGGGASGSFEAFDATPVPADASPFSSLGDVAGDVVGSASDADELALPLVAVVLLAAVALGLAVASFYMVYLAPALLAELLLDGALSYTLYRRLRTADRQHWLATALRRTVLPFILTGLFLFGIGAALSAYAPGARSIGEVMQYTAPKAKR